MNLEAGYFTSKPNVFIAENATAQAD